MIKSIQESKKQIKILKYKARLSNMHIYLCGFAIVDCKLNSILRTCSVISYNPAVYEIDINQEVKKIEASIYKYKFDEGSCLEMMKKFYPRLYDMEDKIINAINNDATDKIKELIIRALDIEDNKIKIELIVEFIKDTDIPTTVSIPENVVNKFEHGKFFIKMRPVVDSKKGVSIETVKVNKNILCELVDNREIVKNVMNVIFPKNQKYFYINVIDIVKKNKYYELTCAVTPVIFTKIVVSEGQKVVVKK